MKKQFDPESPIAHFIIGLITIIINIFAFRKAGIELTWYHYIGTVIAIGLFQWIYRIVIRRINKRRKS